MVFSDKYFLADVGTNCPTGTIILSDSECDMASNLLGLTYGGPLGSSQTHRPAGCFFWYHGSAYLNNLGDASATFPEHFEVGGGICSVGRRA